jgi:hypothetical protein
MIYAFLVSALLLGSVLAVLFVHVIAVRACATHSREALPRLRYRSPIRHSVP